MSLALPQISRADAALWSMVARAVAARQPASLAAWSAIVGEPLALAEMQLMPWARDDVMWTTATLLDAHGPLAEVAIATTWLRRITQRLLGGPAEMAAPRPATAAEHAVWAFLVSAMVAQLAAPVEVSLRPPAIGAARSAVRIALQSDAGLVTCAILPCRSEAMAGAFGLLHLAAMPPAWWASITLDLPVAIATTTLLRAAWQAVQVRDVIVLAAADLQAGLLIGQGTLPLRCQLGGPTSRVDSRYVAAVINAVPDDTTVTLTATVGSTSMSLARLASLAVGEILELGLPSKGSVELRLAGAVVARGELVDVEGELGVRVTQLGPA
ncbi:MAG: FliM/FliN family flagellar motor switch protein [Kofleriaceae bacterium]|nr:FliM/FliN family flagellar motor switch protein [Kofleriaceae bacterium]